LTIGLRGANMLTNCTITDKNGKVTDYVWDDQKKAMVEGKPKREIPWWQLHQIAEELGGELRKFVEQDSRGNVKYKIVIEYEEDKK